MRRRKGKTVEEKTNFRLVPLDEPAESVDYYGMIVDDDDMDENYKHVLLNYLMAAPNKKRSENDDEMGEYDEEYMWSYQMAVANERRRRNDDEMDEDLNHYLLNSKRTAANKKRRHNGDEEEDDDRYHEELNDPDYELFLENLQAHEQSYLLDFEGNENGLIVRVCIIYEEKLCPDREGNLEPRRKLRSAARQMNGDSDQILCLENHWKHGSESEEKSNSDTEWGLGPRRNLRSAAKQINGGSDQILCLENHRKDEEKLNSDKGNLEPRRILRSTAKQINGESTQILGLENHLEHNSRSTPTKAIVKLPEEKLGNKTDSEKGVKLSVLLEDEDGVERDFLTWIQGVEAFKDDYYVFSSGGYYVEYNKKDQECNLEMDEYNDESSSDIECLGSRFDEEENPDFSMIIERNASGKDDVARFRQKVIAALREPYNRQEYDGLLQAVEFRKPEERHMDLRHGRERSYSVQKEGKSYLDYYPDFGRKLSQAMDDKPRCLNLLRGFFIWLKQPGMPAPWKDAELLAMKLRSG